MVGRCQFDLEQPQGGEPSPIVFASVTPGIAHVLDFGLVEVTEFASWLTWTFGSSHSATELASHHSQSICTHGISKFLRVSTELTLSIQKLIDS
jgi:hypothetical protein